MDGTTEFGTPPLAHPHATDQPLTRSQSGIQSPDGTTSVIIQAHDSVHGLGADYLLELP